jgi:hypothetical protein
LLGLAACHGNASAPPIQLDFDSPYTQMGSGATQQFVARVRATVNNVNDWVVTQAVQWTVTEAGGGHIDGNGLYTAPVVQAAATYHVVATSTADGTSKVTAAVTVYPVAARIWPLTLTLPSAGTWHFQGSVYAQDVGPDATPTNAFTWATPAGSGAIDSTGHYSAPAAAGVYHVTVTSKADPTKSATATVTVLDAAVADREGPLWPLPDVTTSNYTIDTDTVLDNTTGLRWQRAPAATDYTWENAKGYCAALTLGGLSGWALPTRIELSTLLDLSKAPSINSTAFPGVGTDGFTHRYFLTASALAGDGAVLVVDFGFAGSFSSGSTSAFANFNADGPLKDDFGRPLSVRCVHPPATAASARYSLTAATAYDQRTHLAWRRATESAATAPYTYGAATAACSALPKDGSASWRVPTLLELATIADDRQAAAPYIDATVFEGLPRLYWSSTIVPSGTVGIDFSDSASYGSESQTYGYVRCVH